ncbi:DUF2516 family protein [Streptomyces sp. NBC_01803]|uniref:DUF2516 family protein n=1 Tax=Streptomyces sp. NBC_01803 TaxID=2975946 RepID=UPI002DD7C91F|nr:DUF2516 family protein [Streptomyces sp. NBC_01803]WSA44880.1 DUF2516 family protein [Streptomyces sp. NBC_01803]
MLLEGYSWVVFGISVALVSLSLYAFAHAALQREDAFRAVDKQTKPFWLLILGLSVIVQFLPLGPFGFMLVLAGIVATIVYLVDVRPALRSISGGGRGGGRSSSDGPYGPYNGNR